RISSVTGFPEEYLKPGVVNTEAYEAIGDPSTVTYNGTLNSSDPISRSFNQIGEKWFNTATNKPVTGRSYFLKDRNNRLWHLVFTSYDALSKSVNIAFQQKGSVTSINSSQSINNNYLVYQKEEKLVIESKETNKKSSIQLTDLMGKVVYKADLTDKLEIDITTYQSRVLFLQIEKDSRLFTTKIGVY
ncbi:MAG: T9SS type A sorting domain-containing protein, partial [Chitinophagales bacterium]